MYCKNCGAELTDGQVFCTRCGTETHSSQQFSQASADTASADTFGLISIIFSSIAIFLSLASVIFAYLGGGVGLGLAIIGINRSKRSVKSKIGLALSIVALSLALIVSIVSFILLFITLNALA